MINTATIWLSLCTFSVSAKPNRLSCCFSSLHHFLELEASHRAAVGAVCYTRDEKCPCHAVTLPRLFACFIQYVTERNPSSLISSWGSQQGMIGELPSQYFPFPFLSFSIFATCYMTYFVSLHGLQAVVLVSSWG